MAFTRKPRYEISSTAGGDSELGNEKEHIGGYGGGRVGFGWSTISNVANAAKRAALSVGPGFGGRRSGLPSMPKSWRGNKL